MSYNDASHIKTYASEGVDEAQSVQVIRYAEVAAALVFFDIVCRDDENYLRAVFNLFEHTQFAVGHEAGKNTGSMVVVKKLSAEF